MGTKCYVGVNGTARLTKKIYTGVNNIARLVKRAYIGVVPDNVQRTNTITISEEPTKITDYEKYHPFEDFTLNAVDSYQDHKTGKNKLPLKDGTITSGGITITIKDSVVTINGSSEPGATRNFKLTNGLEAKSAFNNDWLNETCVSNKNNTTLSVKYISGTGSTSSCAFRAYGETSSHIKQFYPTVTTQSETFTTDGNISCFVFFVSTGRTFDNYTFEIQLETGNQMTSFEPYTGGMPSPNPEYAEYIHTVTGDNIVKGTGKNLLGFEDVSSTTFNGITYSVLNGEIILNGTSNNRGGLQLEIKGQIPTFNGINYTLSALIDGTISGGQISIQLRSNNSNVKERQLNQLPVIYNDLSAKIDSIRLYIATGRTFTNYKLKFQFEVSSTATAYEPYQERSVTIPLGDIKLYKIGYYKDRIYKNNVKWYLEKNIGSKVYKGTEQIQEVNGSFQHNASIAQSYGALPYGNQTNIMSEYYIYNSTHTSITEVIQDGELGVNTGNKITIKDSRFANASEYLTWLQTLYNNGTPFYVLFAITPTTTEITDTALITALEKVLQLRALRGETNISITGEDLSPTAELTYRKDLSEYGVAKLFYRYATSVIKMSTDLAPSPGYLTYTQGTNTESYAILAGGINDGSIQKTDSYAYDKNLLFTHLDLSQRKKYHAGATNGVHAIFAGGTSQTGTGPEPNKLVNAFDNSLVRSIPEELSVARSYLKGCYLNGKAIFVCGAGTTSSETGVIDTYDSNLSHSSISSTTNANYLPKKGKGFGFTSNKNYAIIAGGGYTTTANALTSSMVKSTISGLSKAKNYVNSTNVGKYCIFGGGFTKNSNNSEHDETDVEAYDENLVKTSCTSLSTSAGSGVCSQGLEYFGIIAGGRTGSGGKLKKVECYNSSLVKSILPDLSTTKRTDDASGAVIGEYFLVPNRYVSSSNPGTIEVYKEN